ncbi:hypothetical protein D6789_02785 [Candidatus Woesearchaeota archaeon]|nr:MAG: hypothetical protein D6789_02785 [Candidatus Woesearchaeota archaeon]
MTMQEITFWGLLLASSFVGMLIFGIILELSTRHSLFFTMMKLTKYFINFATVLVIPLALFFPESKPLLWNLSLYAVFILMCIRPLHDLFPRLRLIRLISLRKNLGIFSATIVVVFGVQHYIGLGLAAFLTEYFSLAAWHDLFFGRIGELTGAILLLTSNKLSIRLLKRNWKRVQRLSYVYFFSGAWYVFSSFHKLFGLVSIVIVAQLTLFAFIKKNTAVRFTHTVTRSFVSLGIILLLVFSSVGALKIDKALRVRTSLEKQLLQEKALVDEEQATVDSLQQETKQLREQTTATREGKL